MDNLTKRPDCDVCGKKESAYMVINGSCMCGECIIEFNEYRNRKCRKEVEDFKDAINKSKNI